MDTLCCSFILVGERFKDPVIATPILLRFFNVIKTQDKSSRGRGKENGAGRLNIAL
jgi:hypothetical protein